MNTKNLIILGLLLSGFSALPQDQQQNKTYFDQYWQPVKQSGLAMYYRTVTPQNGKYLVKDFYASTDTLQMEAWCSSVTPKLFQEGAATFYHKNGSIQRVGMYKDNLPIGLHKFYYINGVLKAEHLYRGEEVKIVQHWSVSGEPLLVNGTGIVTDKEQGVPETVYMEMKDSVQLRGYYLQAIDTIYTFTQTPTEYKGGMQTFYRGVSSTIKYPKLARRTNVQGRVYIRFMVDENGQPRDAVVVQGIGAGCDEQALNACQQQQFWNPGKYKGKPVKMLLILPVVFKLG
ncbi:MAG: TonB family protein [Cyclobacteriaceae bacterium]|nr:TonB family protein [Cyclobacteriaceae bacterium]